MNIFSLAVLISFTLPLVAETTAPPDDSGMRPVGRAYFPAPSGTKSIPLPGGDMEVANRPPGFVWGNCEVIACGDAPQGSRVGRIPIKPRVYFGTPRELQVESGRPYLFSFWLKSKQPDWAAISFNSDEPLRTCGGHYPGIPSTGGQWRRVGYYFWMPAQARRVNLMIHPRTDSEQPGEILVDDVRLRTATFEEMSAAYEAERAKYAAFDIEPRPEDGRHLALSVAKWQGRCGLPGKPFLIWAVGSSWTNFQGNGYPLIRAIRERFPNAPPIVYKKHAGSGTPWDYARGWVEQFVLADGPDLILTYTNGDPAELDKMLSTIRSHSTADIIVPTLHLFERYTLSEEHVERGVLDWEAVREVCKRHRAELVENRRELADYLRRTGQQPTDLLGDAVHQNGHGRLRIWDNITRHIAVPEAFSYDPTLRERRLPVSDLATGRDKITVDDRWSIVGGVARTQQAGATIRVEFVGNRIDLIGRKLPSGGTVSVKIDGVSADQMPVFFTTYIRAEPAPGERKVKGPGPGDVAPHAVALGKDIIPQSWTITVIDDLGNYRLEGSVTGADGEGNNVEPFTSQSGQITVPPELWRHARYKPRDEPAFVANRQGDRFTFEVYRAAVLVVNFQGEDNAVFTQPLVQNLPNGRHTLEIVAQGDGPVSIDSFYVFQPPE